MWTALPGLWPVAQLPHHVHDQHQPACPCPQVDEVSGQVSPLEDDLAVFSLAMVHQPGGRQGCSAAVCIGSSHIDAVGMCGCSSHPRGTARLGGGAVHLCALACMVNAAFIRWSSP